jgi:hypothetical protein
MINLKTNKENLKKEDKKMIVGILSSACCYPGMAAFDEQAKKVIEQAIEETGVEAEIKIILGSTALYGGAVPKHVMADLMNKFSRRETTGPAILINGEVISYGVPRLEDMKATLKKFE